MHPDIYDENSGMLPTVSNPSFYTPAGPAQFTEHFVNTLILSLFKHSATFFLKIPSISPYSMITLTELSSERKTLGQF